MEFLDENSSDGSLYHDSKLSNSPLMENSSELSQRNINKYLNNNFQDSQIFDLSNFPKKRNYQECLKGFNEAIIDEEEERKSKKFKEVLLSNVKLN